MKENDPIEVILSYNRPEFNYLKLAEELSELQEIVIKRCTKKEEFKPSIDRLTEEIGDVLLRLKVLCRMEEISISVSDRVALKTSEVIEHINKNRFKGGV